MEPAVVIWNPGSRGAELAGDLKRQLELDSLFDLRATADHGEATELARQAVEAHAEWLITAGGDGTIHATVNGMGASSETRLGIIPLGTGNDFCRTLMLPLDPQQTFQHLRHTMTCDPERQQSVKAVDLIEVRADDRLDWCVNLAAGGNSARVTESLTDELKKTWGPWAFIRGALQVLSDLESFPMRVEAPGTPGVEYALWTFLAANGRYAAGGIDVAPQADPADGLLDLILIHDNPGTNLTKLAAELLLGDYLHEPFVTFEQVSTVRLVSDRSVPWTLDGEWMEAESVDLRVVPGGLQVCHG